MKIQRICPYCGRLQILEVNENQYNDYLAGKPIQVAFPDSSPDDRELILSGICPECWEDILKDEESPWPTIEPLSNFSPIS